MIVRLFFSILCLLLTPVNAKTLKYQPAPPDNPLKGLVPYASEWKKDRFPHSMEFSYISMDSLMKSWGSYDWEPLEKILNESQGRGKQTIFRVYLEYPKKKSALPEFLLKEGVKITEWKSGDGGNFTPDYENPKLRRAMGEFIAKLGKKYDGDPRIGFITMGMIGMWGEWHNFPRQELLASKEVQKEVMKSFDDAFSKTHILMRYPAGAGNYHYADNSEANVGYHDDSFGWATIETGKKEEDWFFDPSMKAAGLKEIWKILPIGGEVRPETWKTTFTDELIPKQQDFMKCVEATRVSWLMDSGVYQDKIPLGEERKAKAIQAVQRMGYEFFIKEASLEGQDLILKIKNRGVAPFYYDWPVYLGTSVSNMKALPQNLSVKLSGILPGQTVEWRIRLLTEASEIVLSVPNPMRGGISLRFANQESDGERVVIRF
ncbi:DUF4832 domain-containing protein [Akkermansiaceae bacterium]|nr:DUF4832 domain-containing protein [Akkermansiaceae bacterium]